MKRVATCCCGEAAIEVEGEPEIHGVCHCDNCKRRTGSAFGISVYYKSENIVSKKGGLSCYSFHGRQDKSLQQRYFCSACGTTLFWQLSSSPDLTGIAGGCFAENRLSEPTYSASCNSKLPWVKLPWRWKRYG